MRKFLALSFLMLLFCTRADDQLPPTPSGYSWQHLTAIKSAALKPDGWFFKQTKKGQTDAFFITKEDIDKTGSFQTGLTLNCLRDIPKKTGQLPSAYAAAFADAAAAKYQLTKRSSSNQGPFKAVKFGYVDAPKDKESITVYDLAIANDKTGTLFLVIFEAPTKDWSEAWKIAEPILKKLLLDDEV
jgi:hypothetical protein